MRLHCLQSPSSAAGGAPFAVLLAAALVLAGCKPVGPNYNRPGYQAPAAYKETGASTVVTPPPSPAGGSWKPANPSDGMLRGKWWEIYRDLQLNQLEDSIATNNQSLRQALETFLAARDQANAARANLFPTLSAGLSVSRSRVSANRPLAIPQPTTTTWLSADRQAGNRTSGAAFVEPSKQPAKMPRPAPLTWRMSTSASTPKWPRITFSSAVSTPRQSCLPRP